MRLLAVVATAAMSPVARWASATLFFCLAIGVGGALLYEAFAIATGQAPTISKITAGAIDIYPRMAVFVAFVAGAVIILLLAHFTDLLQIWKP